MAHKKANDGLETVNVRLPDEIVRILDNLVKRGLYSSRSEAIRDFSRDYVTRGGGRG